MLARIINKNNNFLGRDQEQNKLREFANKGDSGIIVVYGRRRVGKTELIEQTFRDRNILKFEGIEGQPEEIQRSRFLEELSKYAQDPTITYSQPKHWAAVFEILAKYVKTGTWTVYFEELQWMACYEDSFIADLKYAWDNYFRYNKKLILVLCGSAPSFFQTSILKSRALHNRSMMALPVEQFSIADAKRFYKTENIRELFDVYLTVGGIPEYLKLLSKQDSIYQKISKNSFVKGAFFLDEFDRIFVSSFARNPKYKKILTMLGSHNQLSRKELLTKLTLDSGGGITKCLEELELCGFVDVFSPIKLDRATKINRYRVKDYFLNFYFKFIAPKYQQVIEGQFDRNPNLALNYNQYLIWLGFAFERFCRYNQVKIAEILGFSGVDYTAGTMFNSKIASKNSSGYQIDLAFKRRDRVLTLCEIKYKESAIGVEVIQDMENKIQALNLDQKSKYQIQRVLITASEISNPLKQRGYFDRIIGLDEL